MLGRKALGAAVAAAGLLGVALAPTADAALGTGDTTSTFTLTNGVISMTTPSSATLATWAANRLTGGTTVSGTLTGTTVTDERNSTAGWQVTAQSTSFSDGAGHTIPASNVTIAIDGVAGITQTVAGVTGALSTGLFVPVVGGTTGDVDGAIGALVGSELDTILSALPGGLLAQNANNAITYDPTVTVKVPPNTPNGTYSALITQTAS